MAANEAILGGQEMQSAQDGIEELQLFTPALVELMKEQPLNAFKRFEFEAFVEDVRAIE